MMEDLETDLKIFYRVSRVKWPLSRMFCPIASHQERLALEKITPNCLKTKHLLFKSLTAILLM